jgi:biotin carboxylase
MSLTITRKLLILGGNRYSLPGIQVTREAGFFTLVADRDPKAPGLVAADVGLAIDLFDYESLIAAIEQYRGVDGIISTAEAGVRPAAHLSHQLGLPSITQEAAANATSKAAMRKHWAEIGKYSTDFYTVSTEQEAFQAIERLGGFPLIFKPDRSFGGSRGVSRVESKDEVHQAFLFAKSRSLPDSEIVIERFVDGTEYSVEVLVWNGQTSVLCIGQNIKCPYPYRVNMSIHYPDQLSTSQRAVVDDMCYQAVTTLGLTQGTAHIEFAYTQSGPVLMELGARCGGGHIPQIAYHVSGVNEFIEACRIACGLAPIQFLPTAKRGADYRFLIFPPGKLAEVTIPDAVISHKDILDVGVTLQPGEEVQTLRTTSERAGFVVTTGSDRRAAVDVADWACHQISVTYADDSVAYANALRDFSESAGGDSALF